MLVYVLRNFFNLDYINNIYLDLIIRIILSFCTSLFVSFYFSPLFINKLQKLHINQIIRQDGPKSHLLKFGTPTMGGFIMLISIVFSILLWTDLNNYYVWYILFILLSYGTIGFFDDYFKILNKNSMGLNCFYKYFWQSVIAIILVILMYSIEEDMIINQLVVPCVQCVTFNLGVWYILLSYIVIVGTSNAINLSDGLDGLVIFPIIFIAIVFAAIAFFTSDINCANYLHLPYIYFTKDISIICISIAGSGLGFLFFNLYPARVFMGDLGSLSIGAVIGFISVMLRQECLLLIMGAVFVCEVISVILQVFYFRLFNKRIFLMAPIHHHFELKGWSEPKIIIYFWLISLICVVIGVLTINIR